MQYEYKVLKHDFKSGEQIETELNTLGDDEWELVGVDEYRYILKRCRTVQNESEPSPVEPDQYGSRVFSF
jgi:hypothetical protein